MRHSELHILRLVLADPNATEQQWVEAAQQMDLIQTQPKQALLYKALWKSPLLTTALVCLAASFAMCVYVKLGYDWGYRYVDEMSGQPAQQAMNQGMLALLVLPHIVFPLNLGLAFACFKRYFGTPKYWRRTLLLCVAAETLLWYWGLDMGSSEGAVLPIWCSTGFVVAMLSFSIGYSVLQRFFTYWNVNLGGFINIRATLPQCALYLIPSFILGVVAISNVWDLSRVPLGYEILFYSLPLVALGFRAAKHSRSICMAINAAFMVLSPVLVAYIFTIVGTGICCLLELAHLGPDIGWRAAYSASVITILTMAATILGCAIGNLSDRVLRIQGAGYHGS